MKINLKKGEIIEIYTELEDDCFGLGKVVAYDEENLLIENLSPLGEWDGIGLYKIENIYKIAYGTLYSKKIFELSKIQKGNRQKNYFFNENFILALLTASKEGKKIIDIQLCNSHRSDISGIVEAIEEDNCLIRQIIGLAEEDGYCLCKISDITNIRYDSIENRKIEEKLKK